MLACCHAFYKDITVLNINTLETIKVLKGHTEGVNHVLALPNERLASCSYDETIRVWDVKSGEVLRVFTGHKDSVTHLSLLSNASLASGSNDKTIKIWNFNLL